MRRHEKKQFQNQLRGAGRCVYPPGYSCLRNPAPLSFSWEIYMSTSEWIMRWFKVFHNFDDLNKDGKPKFWTGKIDNDELGAWVRLLSMASKNRFERGFIGITPEIPYNIEQINLIIKTGKNYIKKWEKQGAIKITNGIISIINWELYQNEQDRKNKKTTKQTRQKDNQTDTPNGETDRERDLDLDKDSDKDKKSSTKDTRIKILIDYFYQAHLNAGKGKIHINGGKDGQKFIDLLKTFSEEEIKNKIDLFMKYNDPWMKDKPYSIGMFSSQFNKLSTDLTIKPIKFMPKEVV